MLYMVYVLNVVYVIVLVESNAFGFVFDFLL